MTTMPNPPSGAEWKHVDASTAALWLTSSRTVVEFSPAHPTIACIRAVGMPLPEASRVEKLSSRSRAVMQCRCGALWVGIRQDILKSLRRGLNLYCSPDCVKTALSERNRIHRCRCGGPIPRSRKLTCSDECLRELQSKNWTLMICPECGAEFRPKSHRTQFCDRKCANQAHSRRMTGEGNPHHKTGNSYGKWFRSMRPIILERDEHCCAACGETPPLIVFIWRGREKTRSRLVIHHIDENPQNNRAWNLITLCTTCHAIHHKSTQTPWPWFAQAAADRSRSMTSRLKERATSLQKAYSSTTA